MSEESILVVDIGSSSVKAGFSGEDVPSYVFPSTLARNSQQKHAECIEAVPSEMIQESMASMYSFENESSAHPLYRGVINDWDEMENLWKYISDTVGLTSLLPDGTINMNAAEATSIFLVESIKTTPAERDKWAKLFFEVSHAPSICFMNSATLSIFASGRTSGLAIECGAGCTNTVPIFEGFPLKHSVISVDFGGQDMSYQLRGLFHERNIPVDMYSAMIVKERLAFTAGYQSPILPQTTALNTSFCLPDGNDVTVDSKIFSTCTESLFFNEADSSGGGLINQIHESISLCDESVKKDLFGSMILSGGTSMLPGLGDRLDRELGRKFAGDSYSGNILVVPNSRYREKGYTTQRKFAPWIGGSLMSSFETYHKTLKITRQEWEEHPDMILRSKCF